MGPGRREGANWLTIVGLVALGIVTALLVVLALKGARAEVPHAGETPGYQPLPAAEETTEDAEAEDEGEAADPEAGNDSTALVVPALTRILGVQDDTVAYRTVTGPCPQTGFAVETSRDGGASWTIEGDGAATGLSSPSRILTGLDGYLNVVAQNAEDCSQVIVTQSYGFGSSWEAVEGGADLTWHLTPGDPSVVSVPGVGDVPLPCPAARLATIGGTAAAVLCSDTRLATTGDSGANWVLSEAFAGAEAIASTDDRYLIAQSGVAGCAGTQISRVGAGQIVENTVCVGDTPAVGQVAIGATSNNVAWLWAGDSVWRSVDGGYTWQ